MKRIAVFLAVLFFVPLVLSGQIDTIHTVGGWKITGTSGNVQKAYSRVVKDTMSHGSHSQSFVGLLDDGSSVIWEKKYLTAQDVSKYDAEIWVYVNKMKINGYVHLFISFGDDSGYSNPFVFLLIGSDMGFFYPFNFNTPQNPKLVNRIKFEFVSRGANEFEIFLDYFFTGGSYTYPKVVLDDFEDTTVPVEEEQTLPNSFKLFQNYPNPFNPATSIKYTVSSIQYVNLTVYDVLGKEITTLVNEEKFPGSYEVKFNASNLSSDTYFYVLRAGNFSETKKMLLIK